jgi:chromate transporter
MDSKPKWKQLLELFFVFFKIGAITFGGGMGMLPFLENDLADKRGWTTKDELLDYYAIGQSTPGIVAVNVATFIGYNRCGILGGVLATAGVVTPSVIIITIIALFLQNFMDILWVQKALKGVNVAVAAMLTKSTVTFACRGVKDFLGLLLFVLAFCCISIFRINTIWVIIGSAIIGITASTIKIKREEKK